MTTFVNNDVSSGNIIYASDHNEQGARVAAVVNGGIESANLADNAVTSSKIANDAVTTSKLANTSVTASKIDFGSGVWWEEIGRVTVTNSATATANILSPKKFMRVFASGVMTSGSAQNVLMNVNGDSSANYTGRYISLTGTTLGGNASTSLTQLAAVTVLNSGNYFSFDFTLTRQSNSHYLIGSGTSSGESDSSSRQYFVTEWRNNSNPVSSFRITTGGAFTGEIVVLGHD